MALPPRQRHVEAQAQERPHDGGGAEECRRAEHEPELADPQAREDGDRSPRRPDPERRVRAGVPRRFNCHVESHAARRRIRTELGDGHGAGSAALIRPPDPQSPGPPWADGRTGGRAVGRLRFELDDHHRWSLWYYGEGSPVPLVRGAEIVAWVGDHPLTLAELEDSTVGN